MPILDGSLASHYHDNSIIEVTRRINAKLAASGLRGAELDAVMGPFRDAPPVLLNYHRAAYHLAGVSTGMAATFINRLGLGVGDNVLLVGAGMAWTAEWLKAFMPGIGVTSIDASPWIHSVKSTSELGDIEAALDAAGVVGALRDNFIGHLDMGQRTNQAIAEEDGLSNRSRNQIRQGGPYTHIITEHVLEWLTDAEAANLSDIARQITSTARVIHKVTPYSDTAGAKNEPAPYWNWKRIGDPTPVVSRLTDQAHYTTSDWTVLLPNDEFV